MSDDLIRKLRFNGWLDDLFIQAADLITFRLNLPTPEQRRLRQFHHALSDLIKQGTDSGLDDGLLSGLRTTHEALTTNLLPYERTPHDDMPF